MTSSKIDIKQNRNLFINTEDFKEYLGHITEDNLIEVVKIYFENIEGEAAGYIIKHIDLWKKHQQETFFALDGFSHLLYCFHEIFYQNILPRVHKKLKNDMPRVLFLNRIFSSVNTVEKHDLFLTALQQHFDIIVYSFCSTELYDTDFPSDYTQELSEMIERHTLSNKNGWTYEETFELYVWNNNK